MVRAFRYTPQRDETLISKAVAKLLEGETIEELTEASLTQEHSEEQFSTVEAGDFWLEAIQQDENLLQLEEFLTNKVAELYDADTLDLNTWERDNQYDQYEDAKMLAQEESRDAACHGY